MSPAITAPKPPLPREACLSPARTASSLALPLLLNEAGLPLVNEGGLTIPRAPLVNEGGLRPSDPLVDGAKPTPPPAEVGKGNAAAASPPVMGRILL